MNVAHDLIDDNGVVIGGVFGESFDGYVPPDWDTYFMRLSYECAAKSKDPSTKFGAVFVRNNRPVAFGYNGLPPLVKDMVERLQRPVKYDYIVHAEGAAISGAARYGISTDNTTMYVSAWPCSACAGLMIGAGVKRLVLHDIAVQIFQTVSPKWNKTIPYIMFNESGVEISILKGNIGGIAYLGGNRYKV